MNQSHKQYCEEEAKHSLAHTLRLHLRKLHRQANLIHGARNQNNGYPWGRRYCGKDAGSFSGVGSARFLDLGAGYTEVFPVWKFTGLYFYNLHAFLYVNINLHLYKIYIYINIKNCTHTYVYIWSRMNIIYIHREMDRYGQRQIRFTVHSNFYIREINIHGAIGKVEYWLDLMTLRHLLLWCWYFDCAF